MQASFLLTFGILTALLAPALPADSAASRASAASIASTARAAKRAPAQSSVAVATANLREGAALQPRADMRHGTDRAVFARRLLQKGKRLPDVLLLQEVRGSARKVARQLSRHPRVKRAGARYRVAVAPRMLTQRSACVVPRPGSYRTLRDSAILVNSKTVRAVHARGSVRTWGRWNNAGGARMGRSGHGCAEHPWVRVTVKQAGRSPRTARLVSVHVAPVGTRLKSKAIRRIGKVMDAKQRRTPGDLLVVGGDFNQLADRAGNRGLRASGYRDAVQTARPRGRHGVAGVKRRIDYVYTRGRVLTATFDRCYLAFNVTRPGCSPKRAVFPRAKQFYRCQARTLNHGKAGPGCHRPMLRRYYSDHPILWATLR